MRIRFNFSIVQMVFAGLILLSCDTKTQTNKTENDLASFVNPFIGTGGSRLEGHGNTYPGAAYPFGMIQLSPDNGKSGQLYCSGYSYKDAIIAGFSHTHLSGTGAGDLADISLMPTTKEIKEIYFTQPDDFVDRYSKENNVNLSGLYDSDEEEVSFTRNILLKYQSKFSHAQEEASPGYYAVKLLDDTIDVELTTTEFVGFHKYTFNNAEKDLNVILNLGFSINRGKPVKTYLERKSPTLFVGYRFTDSWGGPKKVFFALEFKDAPSEFRTFNGEKSTSGIGVEGKGLQGVFTFEGLKINTVFLKVGISSGNLEGALADLKTADNYNWDFEKVKNDTRSRWNEVLSKIKITTTNEEQKRIFYTALYHSYLTPTRFSDVNGNYKGYNNTLENAKEYHHYSVLSLWDTFRALKPFLAVMEPDLYSDIVNSMLAKYKQTGVLPYWEINGSEGGSMIGYHSVPVIADAILKGIGDFDKELALKAMIDVSNNDRKGLGLYLKHKYVPTNFNEDATVSKTLEFSYDDWCIAQAAKHLGNDKVYDEYMKRANYYKNVFDPAYKLMRGKNSDGTWYEPFHPRFGEYGNPHYTEANAWQYSFFVPHDTDELVKMIGGEEDFEVMMDSLFTQTSEVLGRWTEDIVGRIGQYAHGNEPSHHVGYLYDFIGKDKKTQYWTNKIMDSLYTDAPDGLCGNDDCGQMSAWYVFSSMGFYPVNPLDGKYYFGSPQFEKVVLALPNGDEFIVRANNVSDTNIFVKSKKLNGIALNRSYITYEELINGGILEFEMTSNDK